MNSELLETLGLETIDPAYYLMCVIGICLILLIFLIVMAVKVKKMKKKYIKFLTGSDGETLEEVIYKRFDEIDFLKNELENKTKEIKEIRNTLTKAFQKIGIVKYDAFNEMGGKLSFSLALLDEENTGFLINAMHSREGCYTYIKEIVKGESAINLGEEERKALNNAIENKGI